MIRILDTTNLLSPVGFRMIDAGAMALFATSLYLLFVADLDVLGLAIGDNRRLDRCALLCILSRNIRLIHKCQVFKCE